MVKMNVRTIPIARTLFFSSPDKNGRCNRIVTYISFNRNTKCLPLQKIINFVNKGMNYSFQIK